MTPQLVSTMKLLYISMFNSFFCKQILTWFLGRLGFLYGVRREFTDDVLETAVGPIFAGHEKK